MANTTANRRTLLTSLILTLVVSFGSFFATMALNWGPKLGLDLAGGLSVVFRPATAASVADMQEVTSVLTNRVNGLG
ncbi:MAG: protein translocase subunit SecD, partial [Actinomycetota bacterium]